MSRKALDLDPDDVYARNHFGWELYLLGKYDEAMEENRRALAQRPDLAGVHYALGLLYDRQEDEAGAREHYGQFVRTSSTGELAQRARKRLAELSPKSEGLTRGSFSGTSPTQGKP